ncbi:MAG: hypothetical protein CMH25_04490 [Micavibrio sp.]|nr:hypothetical protein [Micavibrio sp.]|tara:strand:+ start:175070 stop:177838 length:2769 start_codon:yes stop_codon:yes gene_type:complete
MEMNKKKIFAYMLLPQVGERLRTFGFNFSYLAFLMGQILSTVRLIPKAHPYLNSNNLNRFGIRDVLALAASRLKFNWDNSDQIIFFGLVLLTIGILLLQFVAMIFFFTTSSAYAAGQFLGFFITNPPTNDIAFMMLDKVFGVPNVFMSKFSPNELGAISPFHAGFHALLAFYSRSMLLVGMVIVFYYAFAVVAESVQTGIPFGERFAKIYAPIRLVLAILLLIPLAYGFNLGQYGTLYIAKWGSSMATNGWQQFIRSVDNILDANPESLIVTPNPPDLKPTIRFFSTAKVCEAAYEGFYDGENRTRDIEISPYLVNNTKDPSSIAVNLSGPDYQTALQYYDYRSVTVVYGEKNDELHTSYPGNVRPYCGAATIETGSINQSFAQDIYESYFELTKYLWESPVLTNYGKKFGAVFYPGSDLLGDPASYPVSIGEYNWGADTDQEPSIEFLSAYLGYQQSTFDTLIRDTMQARNLSSYYGFDFSEEDVQQGWGGAGLWYNRLADVNGAVIEAAYDMPTPSQQPEIMEFVASSKSQFLTTLFSNDMYNPVVEGGCGETNSGQPRQDCIQWNGGDRMEYDRYIANILYHADKTFNRDLVINPERAPRAHDPGAIGRVLSLIFGAEGLFSIRENEDIHPLAQMTAMGKSIMESTVRNLAIGTSISLGAGALSGRSGDLGSGVQGVAGTFYTLGSITMTIGFLLYYVIPMLPFMYFFFAVGKWVMTIFEAIVAMPLWALAHLKIDGDGLSGPAAAQGYFLLLEIFVRPILVIFGMIAGISVFTAIVIIMNDLWDLVASNLTGHDFSGFSDDSTNITDLTDIAYYREGVDVFFYTLIYTVVVYMMAMSSFKLVDQIPNSILRWINSSAKTFAEGIQDNTDTLIRYSAMGGGKLGGEMTDILKEGSYMASSNTLGRAVSAAKNNGQQGSG